MVANILAINEIVSDPKIRNGRPVIAGTGITVMTIVLAHTTGDKFPPEVIAEHYRLTLGQVHAALSYYYLHQAELDENLQHEMEETERLLDDLRKQGRLIE
jgi:uncharacterized protein (DUF433 family)